MRAASVVRRSFSSMTSFSASAIFPAVPVNSIGIRAEKSPFLNAVRVRSSRRSKSFGANSLALLMPIPVVIARCPFARPNRIEIVQMRLRRCWVRYATREPAPWECGALAPPLLTIGARAPQSDGLVTFAHLGCLDDPNVLRWRLDIIGDRADDAAQRHGVKPPRGVTCRRKKEPQPIERQDRIGPAVTWAEYVPRADERR